MLELKVKRVHPGAVLPTYAKTGDAALDLTACSHGEWMGADYVHYNTGVCVEIPDGYVGLIFPRSSISKYDLALANAVGVIDAGYRGEISFRFRVLYPRDLEIPRTYRKGDRIGQLIIIPRPQVSISEVQELSESDRGVGGFGSSGR